MSARAAGELVFIGDVHLDVDDPHLPPFLALLDRLGGSASRIVLLGDLFNLWIGRRELEQPHQTAVVDKLAELRARGVVVRFVEGNRDFRVGPAYVGRAFDDASLDGVAESFGGRRIRAIHGDLANPSDLQYRLWRRLSRSAPFWAAFNLLPRRRRLRVAQALERRMRSSNPDFKHSFPEAAVRGYAAGFFAQGFDTVVLGHFHVERDMSCGPPGTVGRVLVLPEWREGRRHLRVRTTGEIDFVDD